MTDINPTPSWAAVRQLEIGEFALGGENGNMNDQAKALAARSELLKQYAALPYESKTGVYALNERVQLENGDIVRSTIASNVNNPNENMTGWRFNDNTVESIADLPAIQNPKDGQVVFVKSYHNGFGKGRGDFEYNSTKSNINDGVITFNGWVRLHNGVITLEDAGYNNDSDYGVLLEKTCNVALSRNDIEKVRVTTGTYNCYSSANVTLNKNLTIEYDCNTTINVHNQVDVHIFNHNQYELTVIGNNVVFSAVWQEFDPTVTTTVFALRSLTFSKSLTMSNVQLLLNGKTYDTGFTHAIKAIGLNYSLLDGCLFQAKQPVFCESNPDSHRSMGTQLLNCFLMSSDSSVVLKNNGVLACEGWVFKGGEYLSNTDGITVIDNTLYNTYLPPLLHVIGVHIACRRFFNLTGISRVIVSGCDLQASVSKNLDYNALIELEGVQFFFIGGGTVISQTPESGASVPLDAKSVLHIRANARGKQNANVTIGDVQFWLYQSAPMVSFAEGHNFIRKVKVEAFNYGSFLGKVVDSGFAEYVSVGDDTPLENSMLVDGLVEGSCLFNSTNGVLTLDKAPSTGNYYIVPTNIVPNGSTINQIIVNAEHLGREFVLRFIGSNLTFNHTTKLFTPSGVAETCTRRGLVSVLSYNSEWCHISTLPSGSLAVKSTPPSTSAEFGINGQKIFSEGFVYEYIFGTGWVRYAAATF